MRHMLCLIQLSDQIEFVQKPFNKRPGTLIVRGGNKKLTAWVRQFVEQRENVRHLTLKQMFNHFNAVDSVEWLIAYEIFELA
jgi:hypothetical protein